MLSYSRQNVSLIFWTEWPLLALVWLLIGYAVPYLNHHQSQNKNYGFIQSWHLAKLASQNLFKVYGGKFYGVMGWRNFHCKPEWKNYKTNNFSNQTKNKIKKHLNKRRRL